MEFPPSLSKVWRHVWKSRSQIWLIAVFWQESSRCAFRKQSIPECEKPEWMDDCWPIFLLLISAKVMEQLIYEQTTSFLRDIRVLSISQFEFCLGVKTESLLLGLSKERRKILALQSLYNFGFVGRHCLDFKRSCLKLCQYLYSRDIAKRLMNN